MLQPSWLATRGHSLWLALSLTGICQMYRPLVSSTGHSALFYNIYQATEWHVKIAIKYIKKGHLLD